jgi:glycosyltransferase involved in cell wall biosynthesis
MRVLFVVPYGFNDRLRYFPEFVIARHLVKLGWDVSACVRWEGELTRQDNTEGIFVVRVRNRLEAVRRLLSLILQSDVVHIFHLRNHLGPLAFCLSKLLKRPVIFSEAGLLHDPFLVQDRDDPLAFPLRRQFIRQSVGSWFFHLPLAGSDKVIFLSRHNVEIAKQIGLDMNRISWLPHAIDGGRFAEGDSGTLQSATEMIKGPFGLFVGQMKLRKGWDILLRAVPSIPEELLPKFVFVSSTSREAPSEFRLLVESLGIEDRVVYVGKIANSSLSMLYQKCRVVIIPSRYEGFGLSVLEAFEACKPVIASDVIALNEFVQHTINGYLIPPKNPEALASGIREILQNEQLCRRIVEGGLQTLMEFNINKWLPSWVDAYLSVSAMKRGFATTNENVKM